MNLYLVLALALGVTTPAPAPRSNAVVAEARVQLARVVLFAVRNSQLAVPSSRCELRTANRELREAPLTGASTPRAPAFGC